NIRSAAGFQLVTMPSRVLATMAVSEECTIAASNSDASASARAAGRREALLGAARVWAFGMRRRGGAFLDFLAKGVVWSYPVARLDIRPDGDGYLRQRQVQLNISPCHAVKAPSSRTHPTSPEKGSQRPWYFR